MSAAMQGAYGAGATEGVCLLSPSVEGERGVREAPPSPAVFESYDMTPNRRDSDDEEEDEDEDRRGKPVPQWAS